MAFLNEDAWSKEQQDTLRELSFRLDKALRNAPEVETAANIADVGSSINTINKYQGRQVLDTTNDRLMIASGEGATDDWLICDGSGSVTPA